MWGRHTAPHIYTFSTCNVCYKAGEWVWGANADFICNVGVLKEGAGDRRGGVLEELGVSWLQGEEKWDLEMAICASTIILGDWLLGVEGVEC